MGKPGPLPKNNKLRLVDNDNKNRIKPRPSPGQTKKPIMPPGLDNAAKREWRRVSGPLFRMGLLTELDKLNLVIYCQLVSRLERYDAFLEENGETFTLETGNIKTRPEVYMRDNAIKEVRQFIKVLGLSHDARCRMTLPQPGEDELSEFEGMLD